MSENERVGAPELDSAESPEDDTSRPVVAAGSAISAGPSGHIERIAKLAAEIARLMAAQEGEERPIGAAPSGELEEDEFIDETGKLRTMHVDDDAWLDIGEGRLIPHRLLHQWAVQHPSPLGWPRALAYFERHCRKEEKDEDERADAGAGDSRLVHSEQAVQGADGAGTSAPAAGDDSAVIGTRPEANSAAVATSPPAEPAPACCSECADGWAYEDSSDHDGHPCNCPRGQQIALNWDLEQLRRIFRDRTPEQVVGAMSKEVREKVFAAIKPALMAGITRGHELLRRERDDAEEKRRTALEFAELRMQERDEWKRLAQERKVLIDRATGAPTDSGVAPTYPPEAGILALTKERNEALARAAKSRECYRELADDIRRGVAAIPTWQPIADLTKVRTRPVVMVGTVGVCFQTCSLPPEWPVTAAPSWATHFIYAPEES